MNTLFVGLVLTTALSGHARGDGPATRPAPDAPAAHDAPAAPDAPFAADPPFAVVELFTSEGCSSCPPADELLATLVADARRSGTRVFPIAFHVDYWDNAAWTDRFASPANSARQSAYGGPMRTDAIYTPQMIVNGTTQFVGSHAAEARRAIDAALAAPTQARVSVAAKRDGALRVEVAYDVGWPAGRPAPTLVVALVERGLSSDVRRGENGGHTLRHENVARTWVRLPLAAPGPGHAMLDVPADVNLDRAGVIAFAQDPTTLAVSGANSVDLPAGR